MSREPLAGGAGGGNSSSRGGAMYAKGKGSTAPSDAQAREKYVDRSGFACVSVASSHHILFFFPISLQVGPLRL